jgi:hypothetical protein
MLFPLSDSFMYGFHPTLTEKNFPVRNLPQALGVGLQQPAGGAATGKTPWRSQRSHLNH